MRLRRLWGALREAAAILPRVLAGLTRTRRLTDGTALRARAYPTAQASLCKPWPPNPDGGRSVAEATELAKTWGVVVEDDIKIVASDDVDRILDDLGADVDAAYGGFTSAKSYTWDELLIRGKLVVKVRTNVLESDEGILDVLGHEMYEINALRGMFAERARIGGAELISLTEVGRRGNLHDQAWDAGAAAVRRFRERMK